MGDKNPLVIILIVVGIAVIAFIALLVSSFSDVHYHQYGFKKRKSTSSVNTDKVYTSGRYAIGPDSTFKTFVATAHHVEMSSVAVFTSDRLEVWLTGSFQYFLREHELALLHKEYDLYYEPIVQSNSLDALKVAATQYSTREYVSERSRIESELFKAVRERLGGRCCELDCETTDSCAAGCKPRDTCTQEDYGLFVNVRFFQLGRVDIPSDVSERFLRTLLLPEWTETEQFNQQAQIVLKETETAVQAILNSAAEIAQNASARSELIIAMANAESQAVVEDARRTGLTDLFTRLGFTDQEKKSSFDYLRTLRDSSQVHITVDYQQLIAGKFANAAP